MTITIAEMVADEFTKDLDLQNLSRTQVLILHAIKSAAMSEWARATLARERGTR